MQIILSHISKSYNNKPVLRDVSLTIEAGDAVVITGPSGIGKTTLLRILTGAEMPDQGTVRIFMGTEKPDQGAVQILTGAEKPDQGAKQIPRGNAAFSGLEALHIGMDFQEDRLLENLSAVENVSLVMQRKGKGCPDAREELSILLPPDSLDEPSRELSGGMRRRVCLVRAMILPKDIYVLDEPFIGLDAATRDKCIRYIHQRRRQSPVILSAHDLDGLQWMKEFQLM